MELEIESRLKDFILNVHYFKSMIGKISIWSYEGELVFGKENYNLRVRIHDSEEYSKLSRKVGWPILLGTKEDVESAKQKIADVRKSYDKELLKCYDEYNSLSGLGLKLAQEKSLVDCSTVEEYRIAKMMLKTFLKLFKIEVSDG